MSTNMAENVYHIPALLPECIEALNLRPGGNYVDATFGGGGHSRGILQALDESGHLYGFDQDLDALANSLPDARFTFVRSNFRFLANFLRYYGVKEADGILADLGVSFHHFDDASRGFSFRSDAPLDMRMNRKSGLTAADVLNSYSDHDLGRLLRIYGDLRKPGPIVSAILRARSAAPIFTTGQLLEVLKPVVNPRREKAELAQVFQALRIEVNAEMQALEEFLKATLKVLKPGGRLVIITYHSLEDRMVKNFMRSGRIDGEIEKDFYGKINTPWKLITRQPITPSPEEIERNPRSRSAKLRVAEKLPQI